MPEFDGKLTLVLGYPRQGKTSFMLTQLEQPHILVCTGVSNPTIRKYPHVPDTDAGLQYALDHPTETFAIRCMHANEKLFKVLVDSRRTVVLDEVGNICCTYDLKKSFEKWYREVGWKDGGLRAWATTQRAKADVPPGAYVAAREIYWVGPCKSRAIATLLYDNTSLDMPEEEFFLKLWNLKKYQWDKPNVAESVFKIKDI